MRRPASFRRRDVIAAIGGVVAAGEKVARVEIDRDGKIVVVIGEPAKITAEDEIDQEIAALTRKLEKSA